MYLIEVNFKHLKKFICNYPCLVLDNLTIWHELQIVSTLYIYIHGCMTNSQVWLLSITLSSSIIASYQFSSFLAWLWWIDSKSTIIFSSIRSWSLSIDWSGNFSQPISLDGWVLALVHLFTFYSCTTSSTWSYCNISLLLFEFASFCNGHLELSPNSILCSHQIAHLYLLPFYSYYLRRIYIHLLSDSSRES